MFTAFSSLKNPLHLFRYALELCLSLLTAAFTKSGLVLHFRRIFKPKMETFIKMFHSYSNVLNHICIGVVTTHVTWYCYLMIQSGKFTAQYHLHVWLSTIGVRYILSMFFHFELTKNLFWF